MKTWFKNLHIGWKIAIAIAAFMMFITAWPAFVLLGILAAACWALYQIPAVKGLVEKFRDYSMKKKIAIVCAILVGPNLLIGLIMLAINNWIAALTLLALVAITYIAYKLIKRKRIEHNDYDEDDENDGYNDYDEDEEYGLYKSRKGPKALMVGLIVVLVALIVALIATGIWYVTSSVEKPLPPPAATAEQASEEPSAATTEQPSEEPPAATTNPTEEPPATTTVPTEEPPTTTAPTETSKEELPVINTLEEALTMTIVNKDGSKEDIKWQQLNVAKGNYTLVATSLVAIDSIRIEWSDGYVYYADENRAENGWVSEDRKTFTSAETLSDGAEYSCKVSIHFVGYDAEYTGEFTIK